MRLEIGFHRYGPDGCALQDRGCQKELGIEVLAGDRQQVLLNSQLEQGEDQEIRLEELVKEEEPWRENS